MRRFITAAFLILLSQSCQILSGPGTGQDASGDGFSLLADMKGEWEIISDVQIGFDFFENNEAEAKIKIKPKRKVIKEYFNGHYKDDKWTVCTTFKVTGENSLQIEVADSRDTTQRIYHGTFIDGFLSAVSPDENEKLEMRLLDDYMVRKVFVAAPYKEEDWELVLHWEYERD